MAETSEQPSPSFEVPEHLRVPHYTNYVNVSTTGKEAIITFCLPDYPPGGEVGTTSATIKSIVAVQRVIMSQEMAKALTNLLVRIMYGQDALATLEGPEK